MAKRSTAHNKIPVDPIFALPEGSEEEFTHTREGMELEGEETGDDLTVQVFEYIAEGDILYDDGSYDNIDAGTLETPETFTILSQTLRRAPGGQQVVDVVFETEDIANAIRYEIQVTKI